MGFREGIDFQDGVIVSTKDNCGFIKVGSKRYKFDRSNLELQGPNYQVLYQISLKELFKPGDKVKFTPSIKKLDRKSHFQAQKVYMPKHIVTYNLEKIQQNVPKNQGSLMSSQVLQSIEMNDSNTGLQSIFNQINQDKLSQSINKQTPPDVLGACNFKQQSNIRSLASQGYVPQKFNPLQYYVPLQNMTSNITYQPRSDNTFMYKQRSQRYSIKKISNNNPTKAYSNKITQSEDNNTDPLSIYSNNTSLSNELSSINVIHFDQQSTIDQRLVGEIDRLQENYGYIQCLNWNTQLLFRASDVVNSLFSQLKVNDPVIFSMTKNNKNSNNFVASLICRLCSQDSSQILEDQSSNIVYEGKILVTLKPNLNNVLGDIGIIQYVDHYGKVDRIVFTKHGLRVRLENNLSYGDSVQFKTRTRTLNYHNSFSSQWEQSSPSQDKVVETCAIDIQPKVFQGQVVTIKDNGQYGFIAYTFEGAENEIFFHSSEVQNDRNALEKNDMVQFVRAINIQTTQPNARKIKMLQTENQIITTKNILPTQISTDYNKYTLNNFLQTKPQQLASFNSLNTCIQNNLQQQSCTLFNLGSTGAKQQTGNSNNNNLRHHSISLGPDKKPINKLQNIECNSKSKFSNFSTQLHLEQQYKQQASYFSLPKATIVRLEDFSSKLQQQYKSQQQDVQYQIPDQNIQNSIYLPDVYQQSIMNQKMQNIKTSQQDKYATLQAKFKNINSIDLKRNVMDSLQQQQRKKYIMLKQDLKTIQYVASDPNTSSSFVKIRVAQLPKFIEQFLCNKKSSSNSLSAISFNLMELNNIKLIQV